MEIGEECQRNFSEFKEHHAKIQKYYPTRFLVTNKIQKMKKRNNERERESCATIFPALIGVISDILC